MGMLSTLVDMFSQGGIRGQQHQRTEEDLQKQQEKRMEQEAEDRHRTSDLDFHGALTKMGAKPVVNGMVREDYSDLPGFSAPAPTGGDLPQGAPLPGASVPPTPAASILRPADTTRTHTFPDHSGEKVSYELPTALDQARYLVQSQAPARQAAAQQAQDEASARAYGTGQGQQREYQETAAGPTGVQIPEGAGPASGMRVPLRDLGNAASGSAAVAGLPAQLQQAQRNAAAQTMSNITTPQTWAIMYRNLPEGVKPLFDAPDQFDPVKSPTRARMLLMSPTDAQKTSLMLDAKPEDWDAKVDANFPVRGANPKETQAAKDANTAARSQVKDFVKRGEWDKADEVLAKGLAQQGSVITASQKAPIQVNVAAATEAAKNAQATQLPGGGGGGTAPGASGAPAPLTGEDYIKTLPFGFGGKVRAVIEGREDPPTGRAATSGPGAQLMNAVNQADPQFSTTRAQARKAFASGGKYGGNLMALNTAAVHLDQLGDAAKAMDNGSLVPGNALYNSVKTAFGSSAVTNFESLKAAVASEMATALKGNATDPEIAAQSQILKAASSPQQLSDAVDKGLDVLRTKLNTYQESYNAQVPGDKAWSPVLPTAKGVFDKHAITPHTAATATHTLNGRPIALQNHQWVYTDAKGGVAQ